MQPVYVLYGTETGNAQDLAKRTCDTLSKDGISAKIVDMMDFPPDKLAEVQFLLVVTSTYGNGDPPSNAEAFHRYLMKECAPLSPSTRFSVCGLGDTTYDRFANCGKEFDRRLAELGATRIAPRIDCDVDYEEPYEKWLANVLPALKAELAKEPAQPSRPVLPSIPPPTIEPLGSRRNPVIARVVQNVPINPGSTKRTLHVVLESDLAFTLGDSIGVFAPNHPSLVNEVIAAAGVPAEATRDALRDKLDIVQADARLFDLAGVARTPDFQVIDVLLARKNTISAQALTDALRPQQPRSYSIASSPLEHKGQIHLLVDIVRYTLHGRARAGVASAFFDENAPPGTVVPIYLHVSPSFRLTARDNDIIMIGPGTGVAPFRAFLQERKHVPGKGRSWLFFGARNRATDFFYKAELETLATRLDVAFSRDQNEKIYVQNEMLKQSRELYAWIESGATIYLCGEAHKMARDVQDALVLILSLEGKTTEEAARAKLDAMTAAGRYMKDVY